MFWKTTFVTDLHNPDFFSAAVLHGDNAELPGLDPEPTEEGRKRGADRPVRPVLDLERDPEAVVRAGAEEPFSPALPCLPGKCADEHRIRCDRPAKHLGVCPHRRHDVAAAFE